MAGSLWSRRVRHHVTWGGALFGFAVLLTGGAAFLSANNLLFLVFSAMLALLLVSGFLSRLVLAGLELELLLPEHVSARTPTPARVRLRNLKFLTPSFSIELTGRRNRLNDAPSILGSPVYFPLIPGRSFIEAEVDVTFPWRGLHHDNLFLLSTRFPFGFLRKSAPVTLHRETLVYPSLAAGEDVQFLLDHMTGERETQARGAGLDFYRIRPCEMTDSARLVDWKSTAHTGDLQVREFARDEEQAVEIFLDRHVGKEGGEWFENAVQCCASLAWNLAENDIPVTFRSQDTAALGNVYAILRWLAMVQPLLGGMSRPEPVETPFDPEGIQVVFTLRPEAFEDAGWSRIADRAPSIPEARQNGKG